MNGRRFSGMTSFEKIALAREDLRVRRVRRATAEPLPYRLLWAVGIPVPPPLFQSFLGLALLNGSWFGTAMGAIIALVDRRFAPDGAVPLGAVSGAIYGLVMAAHFRLEARRLGLPRWGDFPYGTGVEEDEGW